MARVLNLLKKRMIWEQCSHSLNRTKRKFNTNLIKKRFYIPEDDMDYTKDYNFSFENDQ